jgi:hypothetical protein
LEAYFITDYSTFKLKQTGNDRCDPGFLQVPNFLLKSVQDKGIKPFMQREFLREKKNEEEEK